jgi:hypothetical protein
MRIHISHASESMRVSIILFVIQGKALCTDMLRAKTISEEDSEIVINDDSSSIIHVNLGA